MLKKTLLALLFASASLAAHAAPSGWNFSYTGAQGGPRGEWEPTAVVSGSFYGEDLNHDQMIDMSELTKLVVAGVNHIGCSGGGYEDLACDIWWFSFGPGNALNFITSYEWGNEHYSNYGRMYVDSSDGFFETLDRSPYSIDYFFTDQTKLSISPVLVPVPEPATYAMMGAGLLGLALVQRRRKRSQHSA